MKYFSKSLFFCFPLLFVVSTRLFADFQLVDAIETFGEKRDTKPLPSRIKAGPVEFHPTMRNSVQYDDNILLENEDAREDIIFNIQPGAILELPLKEHKFAIGYEADFEIFSKSRHAKQTDQNQNFLALADLHFSNFYLNVLENLIETSGRSGTTFTGRVPRIDNSIHPKFGYRFKRVVLETGFRHFTRDFRRQIDDPFDFQVAEWTEVVYYDLFASLKALLEYQLAQIDYDDNASRQGTFNQVRAGLEGEIMPNLSAKVRVGAQLRNYAEPAENDFNSWVGYLRLEYQMRKNLRFNLTLSRRPVEATFGEVNFYREHLLGLGFEYDPLPKWTFFSSFDYLRHGYAERETIGATTIFRRDHHAFVKTGLRYRLQEWLDFELAYEYLRRNSNFSLFDYTDNRVTFASNFTY